MARAKRSYIILSSAWYAPTILEDVDYSDEVLLSIAEGHDLREVAIRWYPLSGHGIGVRVEVFDDSWGVFGREPELFAILAKLEDEGDNLTAEVLAMELDDLGFVDATPREPR